MKKSYLQILKQIDALKAEAEKLRSVEVDGVVKRIREAIEHYDLTAEDLGLAGAASAPAKSAMTGKTAKAAKAARAPTAAKKRRTKAGKSAFPVAVVKFRDETGNTWGGRGKRPQWLRDALNSGKQLQDFLVKP